MLAGLADNERFSYFLNTFVTRNSIQNDPFPDELELLAPWNETVKAEIEHRANESNQSYVNCQGAPATGK